MTHPDTGEVKECMVFCTDILDALTQDFFARKGGGEDLGQSKKNLSEKLVLANSQLGGWRRGLPFLEESKQKTVLYAALNGLIFWAISLF